MVRLFAAVFACTALLPTLLVAAMSTHPADAQPVPMVGATGPHVVVTLDGGTVIEGPLVILRDTTVTVHVDQQDRTIPLSGVTRIEREGDDHTDGAVKGGVILGLMCALVCGQGVSSGSEHLAAIATNSAIGALIGWQFDRDHRGRTVIYPPPGGGRPFPLVAPAPPPTGADVVSTARAPDAASPAVTRHAVSVAPIGLPYGHLAIDYQRRVAPWLSVGGLVARTTRASVWDGQRQVAEDATQVLTDAVIRLHPGGRTFSGPSVGIRAGLGTARGDVTPGLGYDAAYQWSMNGAWQIGLGVAQERAFAVVRGVSAGTPWPFMRLTLGIAF